MDDLWYQKLLLPMLDLIPPPMLASILNRWYRERGAANEDQLKTLYAYGYEVEILQYLSAYGTDMVIAGSFASVAAKQTHHRDSLHVFIPVYQNFDEYFIPTLQNMIEKAEADLAQPPQFDGLKEMLEFSHDMISGQMWKSPHACLYSPQKKKGKRTGRKFFEFSFGDIHVQWLEVPIDPTSFFVKRVPLQTLFIFSLLSGAFDIPTFRIAILDWEFEGEIDDYTLLFHPTETLNLIYRLPGYDNYILHPGTCFADNYILHSGTCFAPFNIYKRKYYRTQEGSEFRARYEHYLYATMHWPNERKKKHPCNYVPSLTNLCMSIIVSLSDLFWVKFKRHFPHSKYALFAKAKNGILSEICKKEDH